MGEGNQLLLAIAEALEPVADWYRSEDATHPTPLAMLSLAVADLRTDRAEVLEIRAALDWLDGQRDVRFRHYHGPGGRFWCIAVGGVNPELYMAKPTFLEAVQYARAGYPLREGEGG